MKHIKTSGQILLLCALTLVGTPALGARAYDDNVVVGTTEAVALEDVALEYDDNAVVGTTEAVALEDVALEKESSTDKPVLKPRKSRSLEDFLDSILFDIGAVLGVGGVQFVIFEHERCDEHNTTMFKVIQNYVMYNVKRMFFLHEDWKSYYLLHAVCAAGGALMFPYSLWFIIGCLKT